ncbi:type IV secretion system protein VirB3 [Sulfurirhabdus autotrophica]|uniref:Type IV secretion system protein VirB3 n=1 Tax=Sulfurirhabdus autotrophica TaxID=1706046 RepID=A0A4V2W135_9PROT|nr:VirB3 family type IV secretion system protein [Sulfurirhabdus autotrophica]TCV82739.1 type IV secretion system protein VirB3 [Sulfurirhabdus autotrophica]
MTISRDTLFLGATRPAQFWGTHWAALIFNVIVTMYAFVFTDSLWALVMALPIHAICWSISSYDHNAFRLIYLFLLMRAKSMANGVYWRSSSSSQFSKRRY